MQGAVLRSHQWDLVSKEQPCHTKHPVAWRVFSNLGADRAKLAALALLAAPVESVRGDDHVEWLPYKVDEGGAVLGLTADARVAVEPGSDQHPVAFSQRQRIVRAADAEAVLANQRDLIGEEGGELGPSLVPSLESHTTCKPRPALSNALDPPAHRPAARRLGQQIALHVKKIYIKTDT